MQNQVQSLNVTQSKKRKLTSPSIENNPAKTIKILKKSLNTDIVGSKSNNTDIDTENENDDIEEIEVENLKENSTSNKLKTENKCETPRQTSSGQKTLEKQEKLKSSPLTKFLQKTDKQKNNSKEVSQISLQEGKDDLFEKTSEKSVSETKNNSTNKIEDSPSTVNNSPNQTDSDIAILSSDEDKDEDKEQTKSITNTIISKNIKTPKMEKIKQKRLTPKQEEKKLLIAKRKEERRRSKMVLQYL